MERLCHVTPMGQPTGLAQSVEPLPADAAGVRPYLPLCTHCGAATLDQRSAQAAPLTCAHPDVQTVHVTPHAFERTHRIANGLFHLLSTIPVGAQTQVLLVRTSINLTRRLERSEMSQVGAPAHLTGSDETDQT